MKKADWVEHDTFVGFDRRAGGSGFRIFDRRKRAATYSMPPSLATIVRQLKSAALGLYGPEQWARFQVRLEGAIGLAERYGDTACRAELGRLLNAVRTRKPRLSVSEVELFLERARLSCEGVAR